VHSDDAAFAQQLASLLHAPNLRAYSGSDMLGAEPGGAMKNVPALAAGTAQRAGQPAAAAALYENQQDQKDRNEKQPDSKEILNKLHGSSTRQEGG